MKHYKDDDLRKEYTLRIRVSEAMLSRIKEAADIHNLNISKFVRLAINKLLYL